MMQRHTNNLHFVSYFVHKFYFNLHFLCIYFTLKKVMSEGKIYVNIDSLIPTTALLCTIIIV